LVEVCFKKGNYGYEECRIEGHAGFNPGNDIVCAAVSALGFALIGSLRNISGISFRKFQAENGIDLAINPFIDKGNQRIADTVFMTVYIGLKQIEKAYPEHVQVKEMPVL
jgi:uncharacterized protein YsxB (DUF464 family)